MLPKVFRNNKAIRPNNNMDKYYSKDTNSIEYNDNLKGIIIKKKIEDLFNPKTFIYKVNAIITTLDGDKKVTLIKKTNDYLLTLNNEKIMINTIVDIKKI